MGTEAAANQGQASAAGDDADDFQTVAGCQLPLGELGGRYCLAVVFDDDAAGRQVLGNEELLNRAGQLRFNLLAIRCDVIHKPHLAESGRFMH